MNGEEFDPEDALRVGPAGDSEERNSFLEDQKRKARKKQLGKRVVMIIAGVVVLVCVVVFLIVQLTGSPSTIGQSTLAKGAPIYEPPGAPGLTPVEAEGARRANDKKRQDALANGQSFIQQPVLQGETTTQPSAPPPPPTQVTAPAPVTAPVAPTPIPANDPRRKAMLDAIDLTIQKGGNDRGKLEMLSTQQGAGRLQTLGTAPLAVQPQPTLASTRDIEEHSASTAGTGSLLAEPHEAYAVTRIAADSDVPDVVSLELLSGPLVGGIVYGDPKVQQKSMGITLNRLHYEGRDYNISAIVLNPENHSPKLDADVANHYGERIFLPAIASALSAAGRAGSTPQTSITTSTAGVAATETSPLTATQLGLAAVGGAGTAASTIFSADAAAIKPTVSLDANSPQIVTFLKGVYTGDKK